jgi:transcriptional regulator with XRE-family HTH domain
MSGNLEVVGAYLRRLREEKGLSVTDVASRFGTGEGQIRRIELGRVDTRFSMMVSLCEFLEGDIGDIAQLMISEQATPERAIRLAENWIASREYQRQQGLRAVAEEQEEYTVKE